MWAFLIFGGQWARDQGESPPGAQAGEMLERSAGRPGDRRIGGVILVK